VVAEDSELAAEVTSSKSARKSPLHESHRYHLSTDGEIAQCEYVSAERAVVKHQTEEGHEESVALKTNRSVLMKARVNERSLLSYHRTSRINPHYLDVNHKIMLHRPQHNKKT
jgi:hypothetical protein